MLKILLTALVIIVSLGTAGSVCAQDFQKGVRAYESGDYATALREWKVRAGQGNAGAQNNLSVMYGKGQGVIQDTIAAHMWLNIAALNGNTNAVKNRDIAARKLSSTQIIEAQKQAKRGMASGYNRCN